MGLAWTRRRAAQREITVLDPNWLTGAIYALVNSPRVRDQGGELRQDQLTELLNPARYPARWHELILSMMQEPALGLCLPIAGSNPLRYLLPDALPVKEPDYGVWPVNALRFRYQYWLPTGFIPRFIAQGHYNLTNPSVHGGVPGSCSAPRAAASWCVATLLPTASKSWSPARPASAPP
ncbi:MAG: hypothetical protein IPI49_25685 [Myxococcales bacterium]|nr:hypothetical protein [Myxococcales bacterium]